MEDVEEQVASELFGTTGVSPVIRKVNGTGGLITTFTTGNLTVRSMAELCQIMDAIFAYRTEMATRGKMKRMTKNKISAVDELYKVGVGAHITF